MSIGTFPDWKPTKVEFGVGLAERLPEIISGESAKSVLIVVSPGFPKRQKEIWKSLKKIPNAAFFSKIEPNPTIQAIEKGSREVGKKPDLIVGIGGGSVLDTVRVLSVSIGCKASLAEIIEDPKRYCAGRSRMILVPTTFGTGSEVTPWATVWDFEKKIKLSLSDSSLFADRAIVDPALSLGMPPDITAQTGMDTLSHAVESLWSKKAGPETERYSGEAIRLVLKHLPQAVARSNELEPRIGMARASLFAGLGFSRTSTAAAHGISYPLTIFHDAPHGIACSITLPILLIEIARTAPEKISRIAGFFGTKTAEEAAQVVKDLMKKIGVPTTLKELGVKKDEIACIRDNSFTGGRIDNTIRVFTPAEVEKILQTIY